MPAALGREIKGDSPEVARCLSARKTVCGPIPNPPAYLPANCPRRDARAVNCKPFLKHPLKLIVS